MLNEFLTHILQVVIVLDVAGVIAWFVLAARRRSTETASAVQMVGVSQQQPSGVQQSLWGKLTHSAPKMQTATAQRSAGSLDESLGQLRRVLDGYGSNLT
jgi:hypothetical protein|tara:strand:- start:601 stop:900 length:300 start_codon:yes stop_codon:yes gene_type:complete